ncbi:hypothetical protein V494_08072, partial [Pseudogymnoascus sp. VKM F-4513 (FW-928)]
EAAVFGVGGADADREVDRLEDLKGEVLAALGGVVDGAVPEGEGFVQAGLRAAGGAAGEAAGVVAELGVCGADDGDVLGAGILAGVIVAVVAGLLGGVVVSAGPGCTIFWAGGCHPGEGESGET